MTVANILATAMAQRMQSNFIFRQCFLVFSQHLLFNKQLFNKCLPCARLCAKLSGCKWWSLSWTPEYIGMVADYCAKRFIYYHMVPERASCCLRRFKKEKKKNTTSQKRPAFRIFLRDDYFPDKIGVWGVTSVKETECSNVRNAWNSIVRTRLLLNKIVLEKKKVARPYSRI